MKVGSEEKPITHDTHDTGLGSDPVRIHPEDNGDTHVQFFTERPSRHLNSSNRSNLNRQRSLTRPERQRARMPLLGEVVPGGTDLRRMHSVFKRQPGNRSSIQGTQVMEDKVKTRVKSKSKWHCRPWTWFSWVMTCCCPGFCLSSMGKGDPLMQQAWREKVSLCLIAFFFCSILGFLTFGIQPSLCPEKREFFSYTQKQNGKIIKVYREHITVYGQLYSFELVRDFLANYGVPDLSTDYKGVDLSPLFDATNGACSAYDGGRKSTAECSVSSPYGGSIRLPTCIPLSQLQRSLKPLGVLFYEWENLRSNSVDLSPQLMVLNNRVLNMSSYLNSYDSYFGPVVHNLILKNIGRDATAAFASHYDTNSVIPCLQLRYNVGALSSDTIGCFASNVIMYVSLAVIVALIVVRFAMAVAFNWFISHRLVKPGGRHGMPWSRNAGQGGHVQRPESFYEDKTGERTMHSEWRQSLAGSMFLGRPRSYSRFSQLPPTVATRSEVSSQSHQTIDTKLYTVMMVTCYSEGSSGIRTTLDSLAATTYSPKHKLFFIVCDGIITGHGNAKSTPELVVDMLELESHMRDPKPCSYVAIADGEKRHNMVKVYAGHYVYKDNWVPTVVVVKCGTPSEALHPKPGNRGKRDSQVILMTFFQHVLFNDRMTELDYELFWKMTWLMGGVTPDKFETVLMVDADTKVMPDSLDHMVAAMVNDVTIMGICGETRIANKRQSWVTAIQVFEYYINHHYAKAFESVFGGVTCLPGCFCMYRIKAPKSGGWVPILANPDILLEYNQNIVTTLHAKNLLLLGEDRFLSTLMLRTFPKRQMLFVPQAVCKTIVPDTFSVLLSQRRRWINSTIHNLMELVLVSDLCGIACLSMQFAVFIELMGTVVLPAAICFTGWLIISSFIGTPQVIPLLLLAAVLGLPAFLIVITTRKLVYVGWMLVYLISLPIWNFVLPVYAYWHFDDFSWGQTRRVAGETGKDDHGAKEGEFDSSSIAMKKWEEWERERLGVRKPAQRLTLRESSYDTLNKLHLMGLEIPPPATRPISHSYSSHSLYHPSDGLGISNAHSGGRLGRASYIPSPSPRLSSYGSSPTLLNAASTLKAGARPYSTYSGRRSTYLSPRNPARLSAFPTQRPVVSMINGRTSALIPRHSLTGQNILMMSSPMSSDDDLPAQGDFGEDSNLGRRGRKLSDTSLLRSPELALSQAGGDDSFRYEESSPDPTSWEGGSAVGTAYKHHAEVSAQYSLPSPATLPYGDSTPPPNSR
ncbi:uncharacterized protein VTP21DRAFT_1572 [Calcarisporiella thermophila]|uniref:uncharacterized protein n=1 Tax=Calcarisporiella thermophila TaxID=911321 RepID=UPI00374366B0